MSIENFDWQGYMSDIGYAPEQIPNEINDEDLQWLYGLWARDLMEKINYDVKRDPFLSTAKEKQAEARKRFLYYAPDLAHYFGEEIQEANPNTTFDPEAFRQHVINNEVQNANLGYYLDTFAASRINEDTDVKYPWLKGLTKDQFKKSFMEQQDIDEAWTSVDAIREGNFGTLAAAYQAQQAQKAPPKSGHMAALKKGWYEFEKLFGYTAGTLGDATGIQWLSDIGNEIAQNVIQKSDAYNYRSKYNESLADTIKNQGFMAAGGKILNMAEENWATTAAPLALAAIGKILSTYAHVPQPLADAATRAVAANVVRRQGANLLRRASQLAYASSAALSGLEIGGVRAELEEHGKYDPNNVADVVAAGLVSSSLDFVGNVAAMKGIGITASRLWTHRLAVNEARARLAREIAEDQAKSFTRRVLGAMAIEGVTEGLQEIPAMVVGARRGIEYTPKEVRDRIIDAAAVGAFMGGGIRIGEIALEKYHRGDGDDTPTPTSTEQEPGETPEAAPQTEPQPPPPGFDGAIPPFVTWRQMENGFSVHDEFNVGYGATHEEAARNFIENANKGRVDIDPNRITFVPGSQAGESWVIARYGENGKNSVKVIGQDKEKYIRKIIELHNDPNNAVNLQGDNVFRTDEFRSNNPRLNEDEFIRSILEQKKTKFGSGSRVTAARRDTVDIPVSFDALPRGDRPGTYVTFNLDEDTRSSLRDKGFTILSEPRSKKKGRVQVLRLHRDGFIYTVTLTNNERDQGARANVKAESIYNLVHGKKGGGFSFEGDIGEQVLRVVDTDAVTNLSTSREVKYAVTLSPTLRPGFIEIDRNITPEGREGFTFDPRDVLKKRVEAAKGKIERVGQRNISYTSAGETTRLDITADGRVLVSRDGRFIGDYDFVAGDIGDGTERAIVQSSKIEGQQLFHVVDIPEELQFEGRVIFVYRDDLIGRKVTREYFAIKNDGSVHFIPPAEMNYVDKLLRLPHIQNLNDARDVFGHQFIEFYALPEFYNDGEVRQFVGFKTENNLLPAVNLEDPILHRFDDMQVDELISAGYNEDFVKVYAIIAPNGEILRATTEEGVDAFISDIKNYANIIDDSEWNPSSRGESIFGDAYIEQGRYTERDLYSKLYSVEEIYVNENGTPFTDEDFNHDSDEIRKVSENIISELDREISSIRDQYKKKKILLADKYIRQYESILSSLKDDLSFFGSSPSQYASQYFSGAREFNEAVRRKFYRLRTAQAMLRIDLYRKKIGSTTSILNTQELERIITEDIGDYKENLALEQLREKAIQAESIAVRLEEAYIKTFPLNDSNKITTLLWETIYPDSTEAKYGSFVDRIHSEGTDFRFSRAAETPRVQRKINLLDELNNDIGTFTLNEMLERGLRGESGGLVILPDQEAAHEIERRFTTDATQPYYDNAGLIQGFVAPDGIMYLVEDGIVDGKARQIILHEYGVHARKFGMSDAQFQEVVQGIKARRDEKSLEGDFVRHCITRAKQANRNMSEDNPIFWEEVAAYAVEDGYHLADTGIVGRMQTWMKNWLWRFGVIDASAFHYQDFVNMAQGMLGNPGPLSFFDGTHDYTKYQDSWKNLPKFSRSILAEDSPDREEFAQRTYRRLRGLDDAIERERNGEDADSIEQATDWRRNDNGDWNFRYSVAGEIGAARLDALEEVTTRMDNLVVARDMEQAGKDTKAIKFATGWYRGKDGKWRYEISNNLDKLTDKFEEIALRIVSYDAHRYFNKEGIASYYIERLVEKEGKEDFLRNIADSYEPLNPGIIFNKANYKMSEIFSSPDLFAAYPELADMTVYITGILFGHDTVAFYSTNDKTITLNENFVTRYILNKLGLESVSAENMRNSLLHEIQHYIQDIEGFSRGASARYLQKKLEDSESYNVIKLHEDEMDKIKEELRDRDKTYLNKYRYYMSRIYYLLFLDFINNSDNYHFNDDGVLVRNSDNKSVTIGDSETFYTSGIDRDEIITRDNLKSIIDKVSENQFHSLMYLSLGNLSGIFDNPGRATISFTDFYDFVRDNFNKYLGEEENNFISELKEKQERVTFLQNKINEEYTKFFGKEGITSSNAAYRASMGESEARMVEKRSTLTSEELRDRYIEEDMDVPLENQINTDVFYDEVISDSLVRYSRATAEDLKPYKSFINDLEDNLVSQRISGVPREGDTVLYQRGDVNEFITRDSLYTIEDADDYYPDLEQRWIDYHRDDSESNFVRYSRSIPETNGVEEEARRQYNEVYERYKDTDEFLKVRLSDGSLVDSNLNERQWVQVRTKNFKDWFGDWENDPENSSKVVDENGEPKVVYHAVGKGKAEGADTSFTIFDRRYAPFGFMFTDNKAFTESWANRGWVEGNRIIPSFLNIRNDYTTDAEGEPWNHLKNPMLDDGWNLEDQEEWASLEESDKRLTEELRGAEKQYITVDGLSHYMEKYRKPIEDNEYGIIIKNVNEGFESAQTDYIVYDSYQINSAVDNVGLFGKTGSRDIRYSRSMPTGEQKQAGVLYPDASEEIQAIRYSVINDFRDDNFIYTFLNKYWNVREDIPSLEGDISARKRRMMIHNLFSDRSEEERRELRDFLNFLSEKENDKFTRVILSLPQGVTKDWGDFILSIPRKERKKWLNLSLESKISQIVNNAKNADELERAFGLLVPIWHNALLSAKTDLSNTIRRQIAIGIRTNPETTRINIEAAGVEYKDDPDAYSDEEVKKIQTILERQIQFERDRVTRDWEKALSKGKYTNIQKYFIWRSLARYGKDNLSAIPSEYVSEYAEKALNVFTNNSNYTSSDFYTIYNRIIIDDIVNNSDEIIESLDEEGNVAGKWVKISHLDKDAVPRLRAASSSTTWCTRSFGANTVIEQDKHDFWVFLSEKANKTLIGFVPIEPGEDSQITGNSYYTGFFSNKDNDVKNNLSGDYYRFAHDLNKSQSENVQYTLGLLGYGGLSEEERAKLGGSVYEEDNEETRLMQEFLGSHSRLESEEDFEEFEELFGFTLYKDADDGVTIDELKSSEDYGIPNRFLEDVYKLIANSVEVVNGDLEYEIGNISFPHLVSVRGSLYVWSNTGEEYTLDAPNLVYVADRISVSKDSHLPKLRRVNSTLFITPNSYYTQVEEINDNITTLGDITFKNLRSVNGDINVIEGNLNFPQLINIKGDFIVRGNSQELLFPELRSIDGRLSSHLGGNASFPKLESVFSLFIDDEVRVSLPSLTTVYEDAYIGTNSHSVPSQLFFVGGDFTVDGFLGETYSFPDLTHVGGRIIVRGDITLNLPNLNTIENKNNESDPTLISSEARVNSSLRMVRRNNRLMYSRTATIDDVPQTARQRGTQVPNAPGMYKMPDGSLHIEPSELPVGFESETILYAAIAISDPAKEEPKVAELREFITADENLMRLTDQMMEQRKDTNEDHRLGYAVSLILEAYDPASDIYQQTVDAFHEAVSKATGGAYQNLVLDTGQIEAAAHAAAGIPYEPLLTAPQETVPTPRPNTADMEHLRRQEMFAASDAQRAEMQVGEDGRAYISTDDSDVDVVFESKVNSPFDTGRLVDDVLIGASRQGEDDDFYNHLADSPHHGTQEPLDSGRFALPADQHRLEVERFLADSIPEHIWRRVEILWEDNPENNAILGNALGLFKPRSWKNKNIFIKGWNRSFGQVVRTAAREASRFGWGMWQNRDFRRAITDFYDMFQAKIYDELRPYYNQMGITDPAQLSDGQKIYMVQTFFSKMNQSLFTDDQGNMGDLLGISQTEYRRILADVRSGVAAQERDLSAFVEGVANDPELAKRFAAEMLRMTMEASTKMGVHFTYERSSRLGGKDRIRVFTNEWGTYRRKIPNTRFGLAAEEIKNNLRWWRERFNAGEGAEKFARQMMRNLPMSMKYPLKWMHLYVPDARLGDTTLGRASQMISRVWQRIGDTSGTTLARDYALMEDIHGILRAHNYDPLMADDMGNRTYREFFQGLGITSEKDLKKADMADAIVTTAERLKTEGEARIRETIMETGLSLWNRMLEADFSQRDINDMVNRFEGYRQRFMLDHYSHRMYEAFTPEGRRELSMLLNYLRRDPRTGEHTLAKRAKEARDAIARAQAQYGAATSEFYRETKEARDDLRRWERLQHLWNREMGNAKKYKGLVGAELNAKVVEGMERYILAIVSDSKTHGRFDPQAVPHYNAISAQKARRLDPDNPLDKELMDFLLEIKDPIRKAVYTLDQQRQLITKLEFNKELGEYLLDNNMAGLRSQPDADGLARDLAHMETGSFLEYVSVDPEFMPEIKAEWENMQKVSDTVLSGLTDAVKANSTVYSLRLMMNNYIGNASMLLASGHIWRFKDYLTAGEVIRKQFLDRFTYGAKDPSDFAKMILREMEQNMVTGGSGTEMSVFQLNKGAHERFVQTMTQMLYAVTPLTKRGKFKMDNFVAKLLEKARAFYTYGDEWVKPLIYLNNRASAIAKYQATEKRYDGETEEDYQERVLRKAIEEASEQTIRETVSWENSPFFVRQLSTRSVRFFAPDFLLHNFQMLRITASNYVRLINIFDELRNFDPSQMNPDKVEAYRSELKKELVRRGIGGAMTAGVYAGLIGATGSCMAYIPYMMNTLMAAIDGEDDKDKDNTFFNPQEWEGAQRILNYKTGGDNFFVPAWRHDGKIYAWNYGRASVMLTHAIPQPATENPEFTDYAAQFFKNIVAIGGGTIAQEIVNNFQGKDKWGRDIGVEAGWWRIFDRVFVPGAVKQLMDMSVGYPGSDNPYREGKAIKMSDAVGITVNAYDMRDIVNELAWDMARVGSNSQNVVRKSFVKRLTQSDALSDSDVASMIGDMREDNARHMDRANYLLTGLRQMGMENKELQHWLTTSRKDAGNILSKKQATAFLKGHNVYDDALVTYLKNKRNNLAKGKDDVRMSREELDVVLQNYDKAIRIYSQALRAR